MNGPDFDGVNGPATLTFTSFAAQDQLATFLASDGAVIIHPTPSRFFEELNDLALLEDLNFLP